MQIFVDTKYDFLKWRWRVTLAFVAFIALGLAWLAMKGLNLGIDFSGGASVILKFRDTVPLQQLRSELPDATIQQYDTPEQRALLIRLPQQQREGDYAGQVVSTLHTKMNAQGGNKHDLNFHGRDRLAALLKQADPDVKGTNPQAQAYYDDLAGRIIARRSELGIFTSMQQVVSTPGVTSKAAGVLNEQAYIGAFNLLSQETVGPAIGADLQRKAALAIILATLAMGAYIAVRFDLRFGIAAVLALVVDVMFTFAFLVLVRAEFSLITVAAFLMVIGYSINDKVVIYDRVRENMRKTRGEDFETILNHSLNQTLSRTILTGGCVMLILLCLIFFGGPVIHDFALLLLVGTVIGTISTLTVVPALVIAWHRRKSQPALSSQAATPAAAPRAQVPARKRKAS
jgi:preprotein translocase subunit SecF